MIRYESAWGEIFMHVGQSVGNIQLRNSTESGALTVRPITSIVGSSTPYPKSGYLAHYCLQLHQRIPLTPILTSPT